MDNYTRLYYLPGCKCSQEIHEWLSQRAKAEKRSLTAQLLWELEKLSKGGK